MPLISPFPSPRRYSSTLTPAATAAQKQIPISKAIMGVFDEFCMGMYNAAIPDELLFQTGVYKEQLSQSALYAEIQTVTKAEADDCMYAKAELAKQMGMEVFLCGTDAKGKKL